MEEHGIIDFCKLKCEYIAEPMFNRFQHFQVKLLLSFVFCWISALNLCHTDAQCDSLDLLIYFLSSLAILYGDTFEMELSEILNRLEGMPHIEGITLGL